MGGSIYNADVYCDDCTEEIKAELPLPDDCNDYNSFDSGDYPQDCDVSEESDCPQHCAGCGKFLENALTSDGVDYVKDAVNRGDGNSDVLAQWRDFYDWLF